MQWIKRRRQCSIITNTYSCRNVAVTAIKKSHATIPCACKRKKVDQRRSLLGRPLGNPGKYLLTVRADTRIPRFRRSSLAMRSSPHEGFSCAIRRIRACICWGIGGRPARDFSRQNNFHPTRCQRIKVSGRTTTSAPRQLKNRERSAEVIRVTELTRRGFIPRSI